MGRLLILVSTMILSCTSSQKLNSDLMQNAEIIISGSQGGGQQSSYKILTSEKDFRAAIDAKSSFSMMEQGENQKSYPPYPKDRKVVLFEQGQYNSGEHTIKKIKGISVRNKVLYVEVPAYESGGMAITVMSYPWFIFSVPSSYNFTSVQLKPTF